MLDYRRYQWQLLLLASAISTQVLTAQPELPEGRYAGSQVCQTCHPSVYRQQRASRMARTWLNPVHAPLGADYRNLIKEPGGDAFAISVKDGAASFHLASQQDHDLEFEAEAVIGGTRFGVGLLYPVEKLQGLPLHRPALVESRYRHNSQNGSLGLTAGHPPTTEGSLARMLGRALNPDFQERCLACHGSPQFMPQGEAGIGCEVCHGPGAGHIEAITGQEPDLRIFVPGEEGPGSTVEFCGQCHSSDHDRLFDPRPRDLLISNQAYALRQTECFIQSGGALDCVGCHDPHRDARHDEPSYNRTCADCHGDERGAALCPLEPQGDCVSCHMPRLRDGNMTDHWIRVVEGTGKAAQPRRQWPSSQVPPKRLFLRMAVMESEQEAAAMLEALKEEQSFSQLARERSKDPNAAIGGFLGPVQVGQLADPLRKAALRLLPGEVSGVISHRGRFILLQRTPRDFQAQADQLQRAAAQAASEGRFQEALKGFRQALEINPHDLQALTSLAKLLRRGGRGQAAAAILKRASRLYPRDPEIAYQFGLTAGAGDRRAEIRLLERASSLDPEYIPSRMRRGVLLFQGGRFEEAASAFRQVLDIDPLQAAAYYNLGRSLGKLNQPEEAREALQIAALLSPQFASPNDSSSSGASR